ncbi:LptA/OstA family protein [Fodinicurvata sp. EGI_FJ10296]|uniref:LptA/OstA family protein n=1 Tax=Fodinicurvata sp. EGI_FJ10296 TaxID=3231908 RepID=UPI0034530BCC
MNQTLKQMHRRGALPTVSAAVAVAALWLAAGTGTVDAQGLPFGSSSDEPIEVDAAEALEWFEEEQIYVARGDARMRQGDGTIYGDVLTAHYRETEDGETEIYRFVAEGNVVAENPTERATGDRGVYELDDDVFVLTGSEVSYETPIERVTASDRLEYWQSRNLARAIGDAMAVNKEDGNQISADELVAEFGENDNGDRSISVVNAEGNVEIITDTDVAHGDEGVYDLRTGIATLTGNVALTRGDNQLEGDVAEVNMNTGASRLLSSGEEGTGDRVRGLLFSN